MPTKLKMKKKEGEDEFEATVVEEGEESLLDTMGEVYDEIASKNQEEGEEEDDALREEKEGEEEEGREEEVELEAEADEEDVDDEDEDEEIVASVEVEAPHGWSDDAKAEFDELPSKQKETISAMSKGMQADYTRKMQGIGDVVNALQPIQQECVRGGITFGDAIRRMVGAHVQLQEKPAEAVRAIMQAYGVSPDAVLGVEGAEETVNPAINNRIQELEQKVDQTTQGFVQNQNQQIDAQVQEFRKTHEHFDKVQDMMTNMVHSLTLAGQPIPSLQDLYDRACLVHPEVSESLIQKKKEDAASDRIESRKKRVERSKRATKVGKKKSAPRESSETGPLTLHDTLSDVWDDKVAEKAS